MILRRLLELDARASAWLRLPPGHKSWQLVAFLAHSGDSWFWAAGLGLVWLFGSPAWHREAALLGTAVVVLALFVFAIKFTIRRQRPPGEWGAIYRNTDPHSFPSGHAARAAMLAVMAMVLGPAWFGWIVLIWSPLVSMARVRTGVHYLSDVLAGALLGGLAGWGMLELQPLVVRLAPFLF